MALLYMSGHSDGPVWEACLAPHSPGLDFRIHPDSGSPNDIDAALVWNHPLDDLARFPRLRLVMSLGAGVDHIMGSRHLVPDGVALTRIVDPAMTAQMTGWCVMAMLDHLRRMEDYRQLHRERRYEELEVPLPRDVTVGILGLGVLGGDCARVIAKMGFQVRGWSRSPHEIDGVTSHSGHEALESFLAPCDVVICLLPLTRETEGILNARTMSWMKRGAFLINAARGGHVMEDDLVRAIDDGHLAGATLDVQRQEPMPDDHPFWYHPKILTHPHIAALTVPETSAPQIAENCRRLRTGEPFINVVDLDRGY